MLPPAKEDVLSDFQRGALSSGLFVPGTCTCHWGPGKASKDVRDSRLERDHRFLKAGRCWLRDTLRNWLPRVV